MKTSEELAHVRSHFQYNFHNDGLMQVMRDSFDMLVIDLYSIRESLVEAGGLLDQIRKNPSLVRRRIPEEFNAGPITFVGVSPAERERIMPELQEQERRRIAKDINSAVEHLFGTTDPVAAKQAEDLIKRFRTDTEPLDQDRNRVRAHRYQRGGQNTTHLFIALPDLAHQIDTVEGYLKSLYLAITGNSFMMSMSFSFATGTTPEDLADILVHGSINRATIAYGVVPEQPTKDNPSPWYWAKRKASLEKIDE